MATAGRECERETSALGRVDNVEVTTKLAAVSAGSEDLIDTLKPKDSHLYTRREICRPPRPRIFCKPLYAQGKTIYRLSSMRIAMGISKRCGTDR